MVNYTHEALQQLNLIEDFGDQIPNEYGFIICEEDDILDPWVNEKKLNEGIDAVNWGKIYPCSVIYAESSVQHETEKTKRRPIVVAYKSGTNEKPQVIGMQITTVPSGDGFRSKFRYKMEDWREIGLRQQSYINYDHFVTNVNDDIRTTNNATITKKDALGLLSCIERDYSDLIKYGYASNFDKELLDDFISYLKSL